jgi:ribosomal protein S18 acetylase RimI-like enzyme
MKCQEVQYATDEYRQTVVLRDQVLRQPLGMKTSDDDLAADRACLHFGCWDSDRLAACLVLQPLGKAIIRMRQVAVDTDYQRQGIGTLLVSFAESQALDRGFREVVMHARDTAVEFYQRLGYTTAGDPFLELAIEHFLMKKSLGSDS